MSFPANFLRLVGNLERYSTTRHDLGFYNNVAIAADYKLLETYTAPLQNYVYRACEHLLRYHPILSAHVVEEPTTKKPCWARLPGVNLGGCVIFNEGSHGRANSSGSDEREDSELNKLLEKQHNEQFDDNRPLWRLIVSSNSTTPRSFSAVFVFHHAIGDGGSGLAFHRTFLEAIRSFGPDVLEMTDLLVKSPCTPLLPSLEESLPLSLSPWFMLKYLYTEQISKRWEQGVWTAGVVQEPTRTRIRHLVLSKQTTEALRVASKKHGVTITSVLQMLIADAFLAQIPDGHDKIVSSGAMSLRQFISGISDKSMGVWVQAWQETYYKSETRTDSISWNRARQTKAIIDETLSLRGDNCTVGLLRYISDFRGFFTSKIGKAREVTFELSNLGAYRDDRDDAVAVANSMVQQQTSGTGGPVIERLYFSQSGNVAGPAVQFSSVTGGDGRLTLTLSWQEGVIEVEAVDSVIEALDRRIELACAG